MKQNAKWKQHALIRVLANNHGNPRTLIFIEPLWGIPYNLITPFATLYMYTLGVTDVQIGLILSVTMAVQMVIAFWGGILTDKLGRKFTTMLGDFFGWAIACLVWAVSQNFWMFLIAAVLNCFEQVNQTAWFCLLIEDADPADLVEIYTWVTIGGLVAVFFAPLSGLFVSAYSMVPVVRVLYFLFALTMTAKTLITFRFCHETGQGCIRREQTKGVSPLRMLAEYRQLIPSLLRSPGLLKAVAVSVIFYITNMVNNTFFSLYVTQRLGLSENFLAVFPILNAVVMLVFMVGVQHRLRFSQFRLPLWLGLALYGTGTLVLILAPLNGLGAVLAYVLLCAVGAALVNPRKDALLQLNLDAQERARMNALIIASTVALSCPFGYFAGWLSSLDRRLPFAFSMVLFAVAALVVSRVREPGPGGQTE